MINEAEMSLSNRATESPPPWEEHQVNFDIAQKKEDTSEVANQKEFFRIKEKCSNHYAVILTALTGGKGCGRSLFSRTPRLLEGNSPERRGICLQC
ncbi:hypothetical protein PoB_007114300 [Plakobranchus ocellatus]|uniref:Uncharacterized protein n=1 Tax=Plakobranchus ocellatus TaxID=259542 RepID=A0AAV4DK57_9GAST|nr:hypothetical protein PoB_007114300 [Plakobranchus ocellatus]